jgi:ribonuclease T1
VLLIGQPRLERAMRKLGLAFAATVILAAHAPFAAQAKESTQELSVVSRAQLPPEARLTEKLVLAGGPFPYAKDGTTFGNRERLLPEYPRGFYREYTVRTPGSPERGARRIVCGGTIATQPDACFYTADHYASFKRIVH